MPHNINNRAEHPLIKAKNKVGGLFLTAGSERRYKEYHGIIKLGEGGFYKWKEMQKAEQIHRGVISASIIRDLGNFFLQISDMAEGTKNESPQAVSQDNQTQPDNAIDNTLRRTQTPLQSQRPQFTKNNIPQLQPTPTMATEATNASVSSASSAQTQPPEIINSPDAQGLNPVVEITAEEPEPPEDLLLAARDFIACMSLPEQQRVEEFGDMLAIMQAPENAKIMQEVQQTAVSIIDGLRDSKIKDFLAEYPDVEGDPVQAVAKLAKAAEDEEFRLRNSIGNQLNDNKFTQGQIEQLVRQLEEITKKSIQLREWNSILIHCKNFLTNIGVPQA